MEPIWTIALFGPLRLERRGECITRFGTQKTASLLGYLAGYRRPQPREKLMELFWPDGDLNAARNSLRVALATLRRQLHRGCGDRVLLSDRCTVQLAPDTYKTDLAELEAKLKAARTAPDIEAKVKELSEAIDLYLKFNCLRDYWNPKYRKNLRPINA